MTQTGARRAISVRQPWAWAIVHGGKDVENRGRREPWHTAIGERVLIHAAKTDEPYDYGEVRRLAGQTPTAPLPLGALIGEATVTSVHHFRQCHGKCSRWAQPDSWHITLADATALSDPVAWRGALGLFEVPCPKPHDCGHTCCDERHDPTHDHFLAADNCPSCVSGTP